MYQSLRTVVCCGLLLCATGAVGCGSSDSAPSSNSTDKCQAASDVTHSQTIKLSCSNDGGFKSRCDAALSDHPDCASQIDAFLQCGIDAPAAEWECDGSNVTNLKSSACPAEQSAVDDCLSGVSGPGGAGSDGAAGDQATGGSSNGGSANAGSSNGGSTNAGSSAGGSANAGSANAGAASGGAASGGTGDFGCDTVASGSHVGCIDYSVDASLLATFEASCTKNFGTVHAACDHTGAVGGCKVPKPTVTTTTWNYSGSAASFKAACLMTAGNSFIDP